jgi:hypothetical protein
MLLVAVLVVCKAVRLLRLVVLVAEAAALTEMVPLERQILVMREPQAVSIRAAEEAGVLLLRELRVTARTVALAVPVFLTLSKPARRKHMAVVAVVADLAVVLLEVRVVEEPAIQQAARLVPQTQEVAVEAATAAMVLTAALAL